MSSGHILFDGVSKQFRRGNRDDALRDLLPRLVRGALGGGSVHNGAADSFWALRDVSFEVPAGRVLGVIGPNGAGKSTILKLLTGILQPSTGTVRVRGRTGALIEVAAGFHGDLTGRENIFLQGAVMGLDRREVARRLDEIVAFAGVAEFLDMPVKRYSSGMSARLGFAVAAHMDPDVLLIDEVLSVGDREFQQRAVQRIRELVQRGIPAVFVSHQLERITSLCTDAILLVRGGVACAGTPAECVSTYVDSGHVRGAFPADAPVRFTAIDAGSSRVEQHGEVRLTLRGVVDGPGSPDPGNSDGAGSADTGTAGCRVQAVGSEEVLCAVSFSDFGLRLPDTGPFAAELSLRLHLSPGYYRVRAVLWRSSDASEWVRGPAVIVEVTGPKVQRGPAGLEPQLRLVEP